MRSLSHLRIATRLTAGFATLLVLTVASGVLGIKSAADLAEMTVGELSKQADVLRQEVGRFLVQVREDKQSV